MAPLQVVWNRGCDSSRLITKIVAVIFCVFLDPFPLSAVGRINKL
ncbi:MAG: hypothetical protein ACYDEY_14960 [Acidimicrobiales bacterium]